MKRSLWIIMLVVELVVGIILISNLRSFWSPGEDIGDGSGNGSSSEPANAIDGSLPEEDAPLPEDAPNIQGTMSETVDENLQMAQASEPVQVSPVVFTLFSPLPEVAATDAYTSTDVLIDLGRHLFYEPRLSASQELSCNSCHPLDRYGANGMSVSVGHLGAEGVRNAQTVYNAALHISQFWDGRSPTIEDQAKGPITSSVEMAMPDAEYVVQMLRSIPGYRPLFFEAFPEEEDPITFDNVATALGAFERKLITPSRFDRFLEGDQSQLSDIEKRGLNTFIELGCPTCHTGATVGGLFYKKLGEEIPYETQDLGRYLVTGLNEDRQVFKVPSLRNVAYTAPYLHDGSIESLEEMVILMARHQLGKSVTAEQVSDVVSFLQSLSGEIPTGYIKPPTLPPSGVDTPAPVE